MSFKLYSEGNLAQILVEKEAYDGVRLVANAHANDIMLVTGKKPEIVSDLCEITSKSVIIAATLGKNALLEKLHIDTKAIYGKREVYSLTYVSNPFDGVSEALVIAGSDKRGTIYGIFDISERIGVSPLVYWGDAVPKLQDEVLVDIGGGYVSKEPSVRYRGLFINDDWPAFGGWCHERFGGYNAKAYEPVFQLILRLKGNYLWPAMWTGIFSEEGPGLLNAELADKYGIVMGASHHEPMCRAGAEWQKIYKKYGNDNTWSFISNSKAITEFWRDGLKRNKDFENVITIGMRGENDSLLLGKNATLEDNINVLKNVILTQNELMKEIVNPKLSEIPRMLALYYEVEDFYYGDSTTKGLKNWEALDGVILMLCDDTFGNLRFIPTDDDRDHNGGFGMYYHYDYHGASISYEWMNTNRLSKTWEQMTMAYDYGIKDLWIVNLGDIKGLEYPLCYFMDLAYDFEKYGTSARNSVEEYVKNWAKKQYGGWLSEKQLDDVIKVLNGYTKYNNARTPESMNQLVYSPINFGEGKRIYDECEEIIRLASKLYKSAPDPIKPSIFYELYYPAVASLNFVQMSIEAGWNTFYASHGSLAANRYLDCVKKRVEIDEKLHKEYDSLLDGKWVHMADSAHYGFRSWNNEDWRYPLVSEVVPVPSCKSYVSFAGREAYSIGTYWVSSPVLENRELRRPDTEKITINIETGSSAELHYEIICNKDWLRFERTQGILTPSDGIISIDAYCLRDRLIGEDCADISVSCIFKTDKMPEKDNDVMYDKPIGRTLAKMKVYAGYNMMSYPVGTYVDTEGFISMEASGYFALHDGPNCGWKNIDHLSRLDTPAMKVFPSNSSFIDSETDKYITDDVPYMEYTFATENEGEYELEMYLSNRNPVAIDAKLRVGVGLNGSDPEVVYTVPKGYKPGMHGSIKWGEEVLNKIRIVKAKININSGLNSLRIYGGDPNIILEKMVLYPIGKQPPNTYFGAPESYRIK